MDLCLLDLFLLLRHGSAKITMDVYAQAVTPANRKAQGKVVAMLRDTKKEEQW